ncbi:MAG: transporter substrate-binding domain-containing protein [Oscillospiraceae bacterium]|nr:transporter substrate-binding domain-containing protein [Oscillospiraceae bacterium]
MNGKVIVKRGLCLILAALLLFPLTFIGYAAEDGEIDLAQKGIRIGVESGTDQERLITSMYPDADISYYEHLNGYIAVQQGKIDAYVYGKNKMELAVESGLTGVKVLDKTVGEPIEIALGLSDNSDIPDLRAKVNRFISEIKADGTLDDMYDRWVNNGDYEMPEIELPVSPEYHLKVGTTGLVEPFSFFIGDEVEGFDIELLRRFAAWLGADIMFEIVDWYSIVEAVQSGKVDIIATNLQITPERAEILTFSDVLYSEENGIMVRDTSAQKKGEIHWRDYNGKRIGVLVGPLMEDAAKEYFPDSEHLIFNSYPDCITALLAGKIDAYLCDEPGMKATHAEQPEIDYIHERITQNNYSFAFRKDDPGSAALCDELNAFLAQCWADGTMEELDNIWLGVDEAKKVVDMSDLTGENGTIKVVTTSTDMPFSYIKDGKNVGYDIDLVVRFCRAKGYALELGDVDFAGRIPAIQSGKYDFTTDMNVTPEREEQVLFSDPTSYGGIVLAVLSSDLSPASGASEPEFKTFEELSGKTISMLTGAPFEELISSKVKNVKEFTYYTSMADMMLGVRTGKTDAGFMNNAVATLAANRENDLAIFPIALGESSFGIGFKKGDGRRDEWQRVYENFPESVKTALWNKWTGADESAKTMPAQDWPGLNGTVTVAACDSLEPMSYVGEDGAIMGLEPEIIMLIAKELDVHVEFAPMDFSAVLASIASEKADMICGSIVVTDERKESVDFIEYLPASYVLVVRAKAAKSAAPSFFESVRASFEKTFIRENRWKLFLEGIGTTMLITVLSIIFGTLLGFAVYMACRNGNKLANLLTRFVVWLVQGMPVVVLLMILFYIIFAKSAVSGTAVAVFGFTLVFGSSVYGMLTSGVGAVPKGQFEGAYALGYGSISTFFRIILPQAIPHFLPAYKSEITALIKATAIVGYIAVQDLTKMGDIVRGRTYEAFFPLIAVAIIYFILAAILTFIVDKIEIGINPKRRKKEDILKGVQTHD